MSQKTTVLKYLRENPHITALTADGVFGIKRLASRIDELRAEGYEIVVEDKEDAMQQRYRRYSLSVAQKQSLAPLFPARTSPLRLSIEDVKRHYDTYLREELHLSACEAEDDLANFIAHLEKSL